MTTFIDERYRVTFGHVEYHSSKDDSMGIFTMGSRDPEPAEPTPTEQTQRQQQDYNDQDHLGAFGKKGGKSKGKGWNDGKCHVWYGDGHFARDCPSAHGPDGKASGTDDQKTIKRRIAPPPAQS